MATTEHKVLFFKLRVKDDDIEQQLRSFEQTCEQIKKLPSKKRQYTIPQAGPEEYIKLMSFEKMNEASECYKGHFVKYRSGNIVTGRDGDDDAEDYTLEDGRKPLEITHFLYIPKYHMLAVEYNHHGPKYSQFISYINALQGVALLDHIYYIADTLFHPDILGVIQKVKQVKMLELSTSRVNIPEGKGLQRVKSAFTALANIGKAGRLTVVLNADRNGSIMSGQELSAMFDNDGRKLKEYTSAKAAVVVEDGMETQIVNLLQDKIDSTIKLPSSRIIDASQEIFEDIWRVYNDNKKLLLRALDEKSD